MGKAQKKHGKGRLDHYYRLAKEKGYRARSSFKIIQINQKFGHFLEKSKVVIDLCAAPGSWCQVASNCCPLNSLIIGVDLAPIKPLPNVISFQSDITTEHCRTQLRSYMKSWKADTVLHDGAPNVGMAWAQDAFTQSELVLQSLKLAVEFLVQGGNFITKVFRSKDYNNLMWVFQQFFDKVDATKPPASRNVSAEIFVVCRGFKAPKKIDPKLLDPKTVFEEITGPTPNYEAKIFNPEKKKRKREGYEEGDYLQYHVMPALEFIKSDDPIKCLGSMSSFSFDSKAEPELKPVKSMLETKPELLECFKDLKVLGKKDFRQILKWRLAARQVLELDKKEEAEEVEVVPLNEEEQIDKELEELQERESTKRKREKRRANERKQKEIIRLQMNMTTPGDIGIEAGQQEQSLFNLKQAERTGQLQALASGKKNTILLAKDEARLVDIDPGDDKDEDEDYDSDQAADDLELELDSMYQQYKERKAESDAKFRAKKARENDDDEWAGFEEKDSEAEEDYEQAEEDDSEDSDDDDAINSLISNLKEAQGLSRKAQLMFNDPLFDQTYEDNDGEDVDSTTSAANELVNGHVESKISTENLHSDDTATSEDEIETLPEDADEDNFEVVAGDEGYLSDERGSNVEIVTAQAMTLAHQLALGQKTKHDLINEGFGRYAFRDRDGLPEWFVEDEVRHSKITKPITKEAAEAIKAKLRMMNARPVKKVAEAKARKKYKAFQKLEKLRKKSDMINEDEGKSEREKSEDIQKLISKLGKKQKTTRPKVTVVRASGANRGVQGRPRGVKGRYKMVDGTMKKEQRALKRISKKKK